MLAAPGGTYNERAWQNEILQIIRLLYPKYLAAFPSVPVKDFEASTTRQLDFMLVDVSGYVDVLEIKQPFDDCIVTPGVYRANHVPYRELSGTVQQVDALRERLADDDLVITEVRWCDRGVLVRLDLV